VGTVNGFLSYKSLVPGIVSGMVSRDLTSAWLILKMYKGVSSLLFEEGKKKNPDTQN
jgi:hypothetical protein